MKKKFTLLMASMMLLGASAAQAWTDSGCCYQDPCCEELTGFYIGGFGGANFISTSRDCGHNRRHFDTGYVLDVSVGYRWCHDVRFEFEYAYRNNKGRHNNNNNSGSGDCQDCAVSGGSLSGNRRHKNFIQNAYMFNGFYDINLCQDWCFKPFVGAGIGYEQTRNGHNNNNSSAGCDTCEGSGSGSGRHHSNRNNGFAWQIIAGIAYPICDEIDLSLEYRFFKGREHNLYNNDVGVGLKYYF